MSYKEKQIIMSILIGLGIVGSYIIFALKQYHAGIFGPEDYRLWAVAILKFIGAGVMLEIIGQIVFHIFLAIGIAVREKIRNQDMDDRDIEKNIKAQMVEDERDKLISMKSEMIVQVIMVLGFIAGLVTLAAGYTPLLMIHFVLGAFVLGNTAGSIIRIVKYRMGSD